MQRRHFLQTVASASAGLALLKPAAAEGQPKGSAKVVWNVKGFSCKTCAVGLQTILEQHKGIARVKAAYPSGRVEIQFDSSAITPLELKALVEEAGFRVV